MPETATKEERLLEAWEVRYICHAHLETMHGLLERLGSGSGDMRGLGFVEWEPVDKDERFADLGWETLSAAVRIAAASYHHLYTIEGTQVAGGNEAEGLLYDTVRFFAVAAAALEAIKPDTELGPPGPQVTWGLAHLIGPVFKRAEEEVESRRERAEASSPAADPREPLEALLAVVRQADAAAKRAAEAFPDPVGGVDLLRDVHLHTDEAVGALLSGLEKLQEVDHG